MMGDVADGWIGEGRGSSQYSDDGLCSELRKQCSIYVDGESGAVFPYKNIYI